MNEKIGFIREVDNLGRIVIPKEIRKTYELEGSVEILPTTEGVLIRNPKYEIVLIENKKQP